MSLVRRLALWTAALTVSLLAFEWEGAKGPITRA